VNEQTDSGIPAIAFFDLDGTLVMGQTPVLLMRFMRETGVVGSLYVFRAGLWFAAYKLRLVRLTKRARERLSRVFKGMTVAEADEIMGRFVLEVLVPRLHAGAVEALERHKAQGERVVVLSAALDPVVKALCGYLGVEEGFGAACEISDGRYTGHLGGLVPHAGEKARFAQDYMSRLAIAPSDCWAYGDHESDVDLLRSVGHPVAVNPRPRLLAAATEAGWPILA